MLENFQFSKFQNRCSILYAVRYAQTHCVRWCTRSTYGLVKLMLAPLSINLFAFTTFLILTAICCTQCSAAGKFIAFLANTQTFLFVSEKHMLHS